MPCRRFVASCASPRVMFTTSFRPITHSHTIGTQLKTWDAVCGDCHAAQFRGRRNAALPRVQPHNKSSRRWLAMRDIMLVQALLAVDIPLCWTLELSLLCPTRLLLLSPRLTHSIFSKPPSIGRDYEMGSAELQINGERRDRAADPLSSFKLKQTSHPLSLSLSRSLSPTLPCSVPPCSLSTRSGSTQSSYVQPLFKKSKHGARLRFRPSEHYTILSPAGTVSERCAQPEPPSTDDGIVLHAECTVIICVARIITLCRACVAGQSFISAVPCTASLSDLSPALHPPARCTARIRQARRK